MHERFILSCIPFKARGQIVGALVAPKTIVYVGLAQDSSHPFCNWGLQRLYSKLFELE